MIEASGMEYQPTSSRLPRLFAGEKGWQEREVVNATGLEPWDPRIQRDVRRWLSSVPAEKMVVFGDISPTETVGGITRVPTGVVAKFNPEKTPQWLKHVAGADIGCGMMMAEFPTLTYDDFIRDQRTLDEFYEKVKPISDQAGFRGGNHFIDFVRKEDGKMAVVVHTGSWRDRQVELGKLVEGNRYDPRAYWRQYPAVIESGEANRHQIMDIVEKAYEPTALRTDLVHNTVTEEGLVRKGVIHAENPDSPLLLPSDVKHRMLLYYPGAAVDEDIYQSVTHATGRAVPRGKVDKEALKREYGERVNDGKIAAAKIGIMVPTKLRGIPITEMPGNYNPLEETRERYEKLGLIDVSRPVTELIPVAYIGHV